MNREISNALCRWYLSPTAAEKENCLSDAHWHLYQDWQDRFRGMDGVYVNFSYSIPLVESRIREMAARGAFESPEVRHLWSARYRIDLYTSAKDDNDVLLSPTERLASAVAGGMADLEKEIRLCDEKARQEIKTNPVKPFVMGAPRLLLDDSGLYIDACASIVLLDEQKVRQYLG